VITLKKLKWNNCFSYGLDNELDLTESIVTQLVGTNGAGKSSIPLILEEVLFNKNSKGIKKADIPNREANDGYSISLDFQINEDEYKIDVVRKGNIKVKFYKNDEDMSSHTATNTYKSIEEAIGIDHKTFSQIVYQNTNASLQFLTATDTNRKRFLIDLLQLDRYVKFFEVFKEKSREISSQISGTQGKIDTIEKWLSDNKLEDTSLLSKIDLPIYSEEDEKTLRSLQIEFKNITKINKKINKNNFTKEQLDSINLNKYKKDIETHGKVTNTTSLEREITVHEYKIKQNKAEIAEYEKLTGQCPTCNQQIDEDFVQQKVTEHSNNVTSTTEKLVVKQKELKETQETNIVVTVAKRKIEEWEDLFRDLDRTLPTEVLQAENLQKKITTLSEKIKEERKSLKEVVSQNEQIERHNTRISIVKEQQDDFETQLSNLYKGHREVQNKLSSIEVLKKAFSTNGLLAYKIENLVKDLEELTNEYLAELSDGRFSLEFVVSNDKLNVSIDDNGKSVEILALSAGELARVNTSTLLAIRKLMSSISKSRINVLFLDEVTNVLDEQGKEKLVEILLREENLNTYIVSHGWTHPLLSKIEVIKEDKVSHLDG